MRARSLLCTTLAAAALAACEQKNPEPRFVGKPPADETPAPAPATPPPTPATTPAPTAATPPAAASGAPTAAGLLWTPPEGWTVRPPSSQMRALEMTAPAAPGDAEPPELVVLHFGTNGAGSVEDNLERWARQVTDEAGQPVVPTVETLESGALKIYKLSTRGIYASGMPGGAITPKPNSAMLAAIVENGPAGPVYIRFTGPAASIDAQEPAFEALLRALRPATP